MKTTKRFLLVAILLALALTYFACSGDDGGGPNNSPNENGGGGKLYCDYGPVTQYGGGCFEISNAGECNTEWGSVVSVCGDYPTPSGSSSSNGTSGGASSSGGNLSSSSKGNSSSSGGNLSSSAGAKLYCDYGPVTQYGGGCFEVQAASECDLEWGKLVSSCGGSTQSSSSNKSSSSNISSSSIQTICGSVSYNPETHYCKEGTTITAYSHFTDDRDGRVYKYVSIGGQNWMAQDLHFDADSYYNITGSHYYNVCDNNDYCGYFTNASLLCPAGWKVPSFLDFANLSTYGLVNSLKAGLWKNYSYTSKSCQETYYENYSGFSAYSPIYVSCSESVIAIGWWSSEDRKEIWYMNATNDIKSRKLNCSNEACLDDDDDNGYRIRCVKN